MHLCSSLRRPLTIVAGIAVLLTLGGLTLTQIRSCREAERRATALQLYPPAQVEAVCAQQQVMHEANAILEGRGSDEEKITALNALLPRMQAIGAQLQQMSSCRLTELRKVLGFNLEEQKTLAKTLLPYAISLDETPPPTPLSDAALHLLRSAARPFNRDATAEQTADALLRHVEDMSTALQREGLAPAERLEALQLHFEHLAELSVPLYLGQDHGRARRCALKELMQHRPEALERLNRHLVAMKPQEFPGSPPATTQEGADKDMADTLEELASTQKSYHNLLHATLLLSLQGLTAEGQRELHALATFLQAPEADNAPSCVLFGSPNIGIGGNEETGYEYDLSLRLRGDKGVSSGPMLDIRLKGGNAAYEVFEARIRGDVLLRIPRSALNTAQGHVEGELGLERFHEVPGGQDVLEYLLTQQPELRERLFFPAP